MVFGGTFWTGSTDQGLREGFRGAGWIVQDIDMRSYLGWLTGTFKGRVAARLMRESATAEYRQALIQACERLKPDLFFVVKGWAIDFETLAAIKPHVGQTALIWPDYHFDYEGIDLRILHELDCVLTTKTFQISFLEGLGLKGRIGFVPHGYSSAAHQPAFPLSGDGPTDADIRFIGNHSRSKSDWIMALQKALPEQDLRIVGQRWRDDPNVPSALVEADALLNAEYGRAIQMAKVNVAVHHGRTASGWEDAVSTRTFEIPACGGFMLHIDNEEVREYFTPGREIDVFSSVEELADKCRYYALHSDIRRSMIERAYDRCVPAYSYDRRAEQIVAFVERSG